MMVPNIQSRLDKILQSLEKITRTDIRYLLFGGFWLSFGYVASILVSLALVVAFANLLDPEVYGTYKFIMSGVGILSIFSLTGIGSAITQSTSRGFMGSLRQGFKSQMHWNLFPLILTIIVAAYYFVNGNTLIAFGFLITGTISPLIQSFSLYEPFLLGQRKFKKKTILNIVQQVINSGFLIGALFLTDNIHILLAVYVGTLLTTSSIFYLLTSRNTEKIPSSSSDIDLISNGKHLSLIKAVTRVATEIDNVLVFHYLGAIQLATYSFARSPVSKLGSINVVVKDITLPKLSIQNIGILKKTLPRKILFIMVGSSLLTAIYIVCAPLIFQVALPQYISSVPMTRIFSIMLIFSVPSTVMSQTMVAHMKKKALYLGQIIPPVLRIILIVILITQFGMWGAVYALVVSEGIKFLILSYLFYRLDE